MNTMKRNVKYCPESNQWNNYNTYRYILWAWMMNEIAVTAVPVDISHGGYYTYSILYTLVIIIVGIPLVYSEICVAQYTNCNVVDTWNFCPILRCVGCGTIFFVPLKIVYLMVLTSWYLEYTFMAILDPPPWFSCDGYDSSKCMVKRVNVSLFQHCIEAQNLFNQDCGMKTASSCYFDQIIGNNNTQNFNCIRLWKTVLACFIFSSIIFIILIKKKKIVPFVVRFMAFHLCLVLFVLLCVALSSSGTWYATKIGIKWEDLDLKNSFYVSVHSILACGTGSGVIGFLSREVPFRSPATMTAVTTTLFSVFVTLMLALIVFSGIKTVSYYHGGEQNIIEVGESIFFNSFASVAEILSYFGNISVWGFVWFLTIFLCLFINLIILCLFLLDLLTTNFSIAYKYKNICCAVMLSLLCVLSCPFYCSDLTVVLADVTQIIQLTSSFLFSTAIYWIYGFQKHNVDIIFMIGVKASYFWKIAWITNPIWTLLLIYMRWSRLLVKEYNNSYYISSLFIHLDELLFYVLIGFYFLIVIIGMLIQIKYSYKRKKIRYVFSPSPDWGPRDEVFIRSRNMFVPEIMTREFLYRQVRIHGYSQRMNISSRRITPDVKLESKQSSDKTEWSILTSN